MSSSPSEPCSSSLQLVSLRLEPPVSLVLHSNYFSMCCVFLDTPLCFERFVSFFACDAACRFFAICRKSTCSNWMTSWASFVDGLRFHESEDAITDLLEFSFPTFATYSFAYDACCSLSCFACFLGNLQFLFCCFVTMTFSILVSRHRSNFSLRDIVFLKRCGLQVGTALSVLFDSHLLLGMCLLACCWLCSSACC